MTARTGNPRRHAVRLPRRRRVVAVVSAIAATLLVVACGASGGSSADDDGPTTTTTAVETAADYGDLTDVCHDGDDRVQQDEQGVANGKLNLGSGTDLDNKIRPGVNRETWDASVAFVEWCNAHGGIGGLEINLIELSGKLFEVESAMAQACNDVFAMVGGGFAQDDLEFSGAEDTDVEKCGLIDFPAFSVSDKKLSSPRAVAQNPGSPDYLVTTGLHDYQQLYPEESRSATIVYGDLPAMTQNRDKWQASLEASGVEVKGLVAYPPTGAADWTPLARQVIDSGGTTLIWVGEASNAVSLMTKLREQGWEGRALFETNLYDELMFAGGPDVVEGSIVRIGIHPLEEASTSPATQQYLDTVSALPDHKVSPLGVSSTSAWLLFATAANECAEANDGLLTRDCVLEHAAAQDDWTGGGLHSPTDPETGDSAMPTPCNMLLEVKGGKFVRRYPAIGSEDDDVAGFHCPTDGLTPLGG